MGEKYILFLKVSLEGLYLETPPRAHAVGVLSVVSTIPTVRTMGIVLGAGRKWGVFESFPSLMSHK